MGKTVGGAAGAVSRITGTIGESRRGWTRRVKSKNHPPVGLLSVVFVPLFYFLLNSTCFHTRPLSRNSLQEAYLRSTYSQSSFPIPNLPKPFYIYIYFYTYIYIYYHTYTYIYLYFFNISLKNTFPFSTFSHLHIYFTFTFNFFYSSSSTRQGSGCPDPGRWVPEASPGSHAPEACWRDWELSEGRERHRHCESSVVFIFIDLFISSCDSIFFSQT